MGAVCWPEGGGSSSAQLYESISLDKRSSISLETGTMKRLHKISRGRAGGTSPASTSALRQLVGKRDFYAGGLMVLIGLFIAVKGTTYHLGTLINMGPGFMPTALGILLVLLGIAIAVVAALETDDEPEQHILPENPPWKTWACILAGPLLFIILGSYFGMIPATFACVFVPALGDSKGTWKGALILATILTAFGVGLFWYFLQVPMPLLTWGGGL